MKKIFSIAILLFSNSIFAQLPNTDIWLLDITSKKDSIILSNPVNITNRAGYDSQPAFSPDGKCILFTSIRDEKQSDIYKYDLKTKQITQFTNTPSTSEYSPTYMPDGKNISVVMVERDSTQRLWKFPLKGGAPELVIPQIDSVGYHCWNNSSSVYLFLITVPFQLVLHDLTTGNTFPIIDSAGRSLKISDAPGGDRLFYAHKGKLYSTSCQNNLDTQEETNLDSDSEDFAFINEGQIVMGRDAKLYSKFISKKEIQPWIEITNLASKNIKKINRIAVSPDGKKMAIVAE